MLHIVGLLLQRIQNWYSLVCTLKIHYGTFCYQQFDLRQFRTLRGGQPVVNIDAADNCRLFVTTMKAMNFQESIPSIPVNSFKDHYVLVFNLTAMRGATKNCQYPELEEQLMLEPNFTFPLQHVTELIIMGERKSLVAVENLVLLERLL